jgi:methylated-DNA-[protein]-cysteine S-methyltransferase
MTYEENVDIMRRGDNKSSIKSRDVYALISRIPEGKISTYGDVAKALGHPRSARAVGSILRKNPNPILVPCHRVILNHGNIGGYSLGVKLKQELLEKEGLRFRNGTLEDLDLHRLILE